MTEDAVTVTVAAYVVSRLPDDSSDHATWSVRVEARGKGRWAVVNMGYVLNKQGEWEHEPQPSSRTEEWLATVRWDDAEEAIAAAKAVEPHVRWNGLTPADVLARRVVSGRRLVPCARCAGTGEYPPTDGDECSFCGGTGEVEASQFGRTGQ